MCTQQHSEGNENLRSLKVSTCLLNRTINSEPWAGESKLWDNDQKIYGGKSWTIQVSQQIDLRRSILMSIPCLRCKEYSSCYWEDTFHMGKFMSYFQVKEADLRALPLPAISQVPSDQNQHTTQWHVLGWHILHPLKTLSYDKEGKIVLLLSQDFRLYLRIKLA